MFYLMMIATHFSYGCRNLDIWQRSIQIAREETHCHHYMSYYHHSPTHQKKKKIKNKKEKKKKKKTNISKTSLEYNLNIFNYLSRMKKKSYFSLNIKRGETQMISLGRILNHRTILPVDSPQAAELTII